MLLLPRFSFLKSLSFLDLFGGGGEGSRSASTGTCSGSGTGSGASSGAASGAGSNSTGRSGSGSSTGAGSSSISSLRFLLFFSLRASFLAFLDVAGGGDVSLAGSSSVSGAGTGSAAGSVSDSFAAGDSSLGVVDFPASQPKSPKLGGASYSAGGDAGGGAIGVSGTRKLSTGISGRSGFDSSGCVSATVSFSLGPSSVAVSTGGSWSSPPVSGASMLLEPDY